MFISSAPWMPLPRKPTNGCAYVARVAFKWGADRVFMPGEDFPAAELSVDELRAYHLWQAGKLDVKEPTVAVTMPVVPAPSTEPSRPKHHKRSWR